MELTDPQIKALLQASRPPSDPILLTLEDDIMATIEATPSHQPMLQKSRKWAKISLRASLLAACCLIISLLYHLLNNPPSGAEFLAAAMPSLMVIVLFALLYPLVYFGLSRNNKEYDQMRSRIPFS